MVSLFTISGLVELLAQLIISLIAGVILMFPIVTIYVVITNLIIKKRIPKDLLNKKNETIKKEITNNTRESRTISDSELRKYAERGYRFGNESSAEYRQFERGVETAISGEKLQAPSVADIGTTKRAFKTAWSRS